MLKYASIFGDEYELSGKKWRPQFVVACEEQTKLFILDSETVVKINKKLNEGDKYKEQVNFLKQPIYGFEKISAMARSRIIRCLTEKKMYPGMKLVEEGKSYNSAFIIKQGECVLMSTRNPYYSKFQTEDRKMLLRKALNGGGLAD